MSTGWAPGQIVDDKYRIEREIGAGGMGVVVAAEHLDLGRSVAIKFLRPGTPDLLVKRFEQEARAVAQIGGGHVVEVFDVDRLATGEPYIVMELLQGESLAQRLATEGQLPYEQVAAYLLQVCLVMGRAHSQGIVHRDLKPANIFVCTDVDDHPDHGSAFVKVLDFGISKLRSNDSRQAEASLTETEAAMGTPDYMSPEQWASAKHVDARSDIWSLGVIGYELLTGHLPFSGETIIEIATAIMGVHPAPSLHEQCPQVPAELCAALQGCLTKDPNERPQNVAELAAALQPFAPERFGLTARRVSDSLGLRPVDQATSPEPMVSDRPGVPSESPPESTPARQPPELSKTRRSWWLFVAGALLGAAAGVIATLGLNQPGPTVDSLNTPLQSEVGWPGIFLPGDLDPQIKPELERAAAELNNNRRAIAQNIAVQLLVKLRQEPPSLQRRRMAQQVKFLLVQVYEVELLDTLQPAESLATFQDPIQMLRLRQSILTKAYASLADKNTDPHTSAALPKSDSSAVPPKGEAARILSRETAYCALLRVARLDLRAAELVKNLPVPKGFRDGPLSLGPKEVARTYEQSVLFYLQHGRTMLSNAELIRPPEPGPCEKQVQPISEGINKYEATLTR